MVRPRVPEGEAILDNEELTMEEYSANARKRERQYRSVVKHLIDRVGIPSGAKVLQIGPGPDWIGIWLITERPDIKLIGLEPSPDMIRVAKKNLLDEGLEEDTIEYFVGVVEDLTRFEDGSFDLAFSNESLHHWVNPVMAFREIHRVLRESGRLCILDDHRDLSIPERVVVDGIGRLLAGKWHKWWKSSIDASYTREEAEHMFSEAGISDWTATAQFLVLRIERSASL